MKQTILIASIVLLLGATAPGFTACKIIGGPPPPVEPPKPHNLYYLLFDQSLSLASNCQAPPADNEQTEWRKAGEQIVWSLDGGDSIAILGIHDQSHSAKPIYQDQMPVLPEDATYEIERLIRAKWAEIRGKARDAIAAALNPPKRALATDIFGALNRIHPGKNQVTQICIFSDLKESTSVLDLERLQLTEENLLPSLNAAIRKYDWQEDQLRGAKVYCLLDSVGLGCRPTSPNDRTSLRRFWESFFRSFKAELIAFETHLPPGHFERHLSPNQSERAIDEDE
jgi:hypothetical protein